MLDYCRGQRYDGAGLVLPKGLLVLFFLNILRSSIFIVHSINSIFVLQVPANSDCVTTMSHITAWSTGKQEGLESSLTNYPGIKKIN